MIQQRLMTTRDDSQLKYEKIKESILNDPRLCFTSNFKISVI